MSFQDCFNLQRAGIGAKHEKPAEKLRLVQAIRGASQVTVSKTTCSAIMHTCQKANGKKLYLRIKATNTPNQLDYSRLQRDVSEPVTILASLCYTPTGRLFASQVCFHIYVSQEVNVRLK